MGFGAGITFNKPTSNDGHSNQGRALVYRWHGFHSGWGPSLGIDWHSTDFDHTFGSTTVPMGTLRTRAVLVGYGYTKHVKRFSASAGVGGGYSFNGFSTVTSPGLFGVDTHNSWVVRPDVSAWYDVFRHLAVGVSVAYLVNRPDGSGPDSIVDDGGDATLLIHMGSEFEAAGVRYTINTDGPYLLNTHLRLEYQMLLDNKVLTEAEAERSVAVARAATFVR